MTEETPKKKPRKKRRTKAQIEADAAKLADAEAARQSALIAEAEAAEAEAAKEKEIDEIIEEEKEVEEAPKVATKPTLKDLEGDVDYMEFTPATYANPNMERIANRFKHRRAVRKARLSNE